jgi:glycosyltransferase involved in cell wall biosynthesis
VLVVSDVSSFMRGGVPAETRELLQGLATAGQPTALMSNAALDAGESAWFALGHETAGGVAAALRGALARFRPDLVHLMSMSSPGLRRLAPVLADVPWLLTCHSISPHERKLGRFHANEALHYGARALRFAPNSIAWRWVHRRFAPPRMVVHSRFVADTAVRYGYPRTRISVIPLGFAAAPASAGEPDARPSSQRLRLLTIAGLAHSKGLHDLVAALPLLARRFGAIEYRIIGEVRDPSYLDYLHRLAGRLGVLEQLSITTNATEEQKLEALRATDVYVQPSHEEGFCLAYIEAAGIVPRLVGADAGAIAAVSEGDPGARVVPPRTPAALAAAICEVAACELPAAHMVQRAERLQARFGWPAYLAAHQQLYAALRTPTPRQPTERHQP